MEAYSYRAAASETNFSVRLGRSQAVNVTIANVSYTIGKVSRGHLIFSNYVSGFD